MLGRKAFLIQSNIEFLKTERGTASTATAADLHDGADLVYHRGSADLPKTKPRPRK
jgi:hypothetical protein